MKTHKLFYRVLTVLILCTVLLPWGSGSLGGMAWAACPVTAEGWHEVGADSACAGGISNNSGASVWARVAIAPDGTPYVAWGDRSSGSGWNAEIYVRRWNGSSWEEVGAGSASGGGISENSGESAWPSMAIAPDGTPYVAWQDAVGGGHQIYLRRWNGSSWEEVGAGSASGGGISNRSHSSTPSMAIGPDGTPYVAWRYYSGSGPNAEIYVRRWNGSSWEEVGAGSASGGGISNNGGESEEPSMAVAPDGMPYVAWRDDSSIQFLEQIYVRRWNGSSWEEVGAGSASGGGISNNSGRSDSTDPSVAIAPDGTPYVAWQDDRSGNVEIYVRRWNGSSWEEVGAGSASGGGISNNSGWSGWPWMAIAPDGTPYVAWGDYSSGCIGDCPAIYVRRWDGSSWEEVGAGSASGGGISDNSDESNLGSMAIAPDGTPYVAWHDASGGDFEIYVRRFVTPVSADAGGPYSVDEGGSVTVTASGSGPDGDTLSFAWDLDNDGTFETPGQSVIFSAADLDGPSSHTITVQVTDSGGLTATDQTTVEVLNVAPTVDAGPDATIIEGDIFSGTGTFSDPGADTWTATVDYGDGSGVQLLTLTDNTFDLSHVYADAGIYATTVTVTDDDGGEGSDTLTVNVLTPEEAVQDLIDTVEGFNLQQGIENSLDAKLDAALQALEDLSDNNDVAAINTLEAFVNAVEAQRGNKLTDAQADELVEKAQAVINSLS